MVSGESLAIALFTLSKIENIPVDSPNQVIGFSFQFLDRDLISVTFVYAGVEIIDQFVNGATCNTAELHVFLIVPTAVAFRDIVGNRDGCSPHLICQGVFLLRWKFPNKTVNAFAKSSGDVIQLELIQFEASFFHRMDLSPPLTTHH